MFDVVIVGGGLAGCSAAISLARQQYRVALLEAGTYPRAKVCGEFFSPESVTLFRQLGFLPRLEALQPASICTVRITTMHGAEWSARLPAPAIGISRFALDNALAEHAEAHGVTVMQGTRVSSIAGDFASGFTVTAQSGDGRVELTASAIIAAHGKRSNIDRVLKRDAYRPAQIVHWPETALRR